MKPIRILLNGSKCKLDLNLSFLLFYLTKTEPNFMMVWGNIFLKSRIYHSYCDILYKIYVFTPIY